MSPWWKVRASVRLPGGAVNTPFLPRWERDRLSGIRMPGVVLPWYRRGYLSGSGSARSTKAEGGGATAVPMMRLSSVARTGLLTYS